MVNGWHDASSSRVVRHEKHGINSTTLWRSRCIQRRASLWTTLCATSRPHHWNGSIGDVPTHIALSNISSRTDGYEKVYSQPAQQRKESLQPLPFIAPLSFVKHKDKLPGIIGYDARTSIRKANSIPILCPDKMFDRLRQVLYFS